MEENKTVEKIIDALISKAAFYIATAILLEVEPRGDVESARHVVVGRISDQVKAELHGRGDKTYAKEDGE